MFRSTWFDEDYCMAAEESGYAIGAQANVSYEIVTAQGRYSDALKTKCENEFDSKKEGFLADQRLLTHRPTGRWPRRGLCRLVYLSTWHGIRIHPIGSSTTS